MGWLDNLGEYVDQAFVELGLPSDADIEKFIGAKSKDLNNRALKSEWHGEYAEARKMLGMELGAIEQLKVQIGKFQRTGSHPSEAKKLQKDLERKVRRVKKIIDNPNAAQAYYSRLNSQYGEALDAMYANLNDDLNAFNDFMNDISMGIDTAWDQISKNVEDTTTAAMNYATGVVNYVSNSVLTQYRKARGIADPDATEQKMGGLRQEAHKQLTSHIEFLREADENFSDLIDDSEKIAFIQLNALESYNKILNNISEMKELKKDREINIKSDEIIDAIQQFKDSNSFNEEAILISLAAKETSHLNNLPFKTSNIEKRIEKLQNIDTNQTTVSELAKQRREFLADNPMINVWQRHQEGAIYGSADVEQLNRDISLINQTMKRPIPEEDRYLVELTKNISVNMENSFATKNGLQAKDAYKIIKQDAYSQLVGDIKAEAGMTKQHKSLFGGVLTAVENLKRAITKYASTEKYVARKSKSMTNAFETLKKRPNDDPEAPSPPAAKKAKKEGHESTSKSDRMDIDFDSLEEVDVERELAEQDLEGMLPMLDEMIRRQEAEEKKEKTPGKKENASENKGTPPKNRW